jgi:hypothetical protein
MRLKSNSYADPMSFALDNGKYYDVNFFQYYPSLPSKNAHPSAYLLAQAFNKIPLPKYIIDRILEIQREQGVNTTLWGLRNEKNKFSLEFYFFYPEKFKQNSFKELKKILNPHIKKQFTTETLKKGYYLISYNLDSPEIKALNVYYPVINRSKPMITIDDTGFSFNLENPVFHSYLFSPGQKALTKTNTYYTFFGVHQLFGILEKTYEVCRKLFPKENCLLANKYLGLPYLFQNGRMFHSSAITVKKETIGLYFIGLSIENFILFLKTHRYPPAYIKALETEKQNLAHLKYDVGLDFYLANGKFKIKKTAFFGSF